MVNPRDGELVLAGLILESKRRLFKNAIDTLVSCHLGDEDSCVWAANFMVLVSQELNPNNKTFRNNLPQKFFDELKSTLRYNNYDNRNV